MEKTIQIERLVETQEKLIKSLEERIKLQERYIKELLNNKKI